MRDTEDQARSFGKGNEGTETALFTAILKKECFDGSTACQPSPVKVEEILCSQSSCTFLTELMKKEILQYEKNVLTKLRAFVAQIMKHCDDAKGHMGTEDMKLNNSVNKTVAWTTATHVTPSGLQKIYEQPPSKGCETATDQPVLCALIEKIFSISKQ